MQNNIQKPVLLVIGDNDLVYGIEHGFYPKFLQNINKKALKVLSIDNHNCEYNLTKSPVGDGMDFYVWNPSAGNYLSMWDSALADILISDKSFAIKEALVYMGAKDIVLSEETVKKQSIFTKIGNFFGINDKVGIELANVDFGLKHSKEVTREIRSTIESHDINRKAKSYNEVLEFLCEHGLTNDASLMMLLDRLKKDGEIRGTEKYTVSYLEEVQNALDIAASINFKLFNDKLDFSRKKNIVHTMSKTLEINFG